MECIEARNAIGIRGAWNFLYHDIDSDSGQHFTELTELFVWPLFRRAGLATMLEKIACDRGKDFGSQEMRLVFNEADFHPSPARTAGRLFGPARGYQWRWRTRTGPRAVATGIKTL